MRHPVPFFESLVLLYNSIINMHIYTYTCRIHIDAMKTSDTVLRKIYLSLWLCVWEGVEDWTKLQYIDPHSYGHQCCPSRSPDAQPEARGPIFLLSAGFLYHVMSPTGLVSKLTNFLSSPSYIIVPSPTQSLEWHVWSSSSGNNCHAVHRSLSSGASVYDCTMGFYLIPYFSQARLRDFFP